MLTNLGMTDIWENQRSIEISLETFRTLVRNRSSELYEQWRINELNTNQKCTFYRLIELKSDRIQDYVKVLDYKFMVPLARFRCRSNNMPMNRWLRNRRRSDTMPKCNLCDKNEVADEFHYVFVCTRFDAERKTLIPVSYRSRPNILKLRALFQCSQISVLKSLSKFVAILQRHFD